MLRFERHVVATLVGHLEPDRRRQIESWVDEMLGAMPEHLRAGVVAESLLFGAWAGARRRLGRGGADSDGAAPLAALESSPIDLVRQYVRLFSGLTLLAEHELAPAAA